MSPFMIFALVLTIAYAIYYAVVIAKDLQGKDAPTLPKRCSTWTVWRKRNPWR